MHNAPNKSERIRIYLNNVFHNEKNPNLLEHCVSQWKESEFTWILCFAMKRIWVYLNTVFHSEKNPNILENCVSQWKRFKFTWTLCFTMKRIRIYLNTVFHNENNPNLFGIYLNTVILYRHRDVKGYSIGLIWQDNRVAPVDQGYLDLVFF